MKITYEFTDEDEFTRKIFDAAPVLHSALLDIYQAIRQHIKYERGSPEEVIDEISALVAESCVLDLE